MNVTPLVVSSAYRQLQAVERDFVDQYISEIERRAENANKSLRVFGKTIPVDLYENSRGLLDRQIVLAAIAERITTIAEQSELTPRRILKELQNIAFSSMVDYTSIATSAAGANIERVVDLSNCTPDQMAAIQELTIKELPRGGRELKIKLYDKLNGIGKLMTYMGMLEADNKYWQKQEAQRTAETNQTAAIAAGATDQDAADNYLSYLESSG